MRNVVELATGAGRPGELVKNAPPARPPARPPLGRPRPIDRTARTEARVRAPTPTAATAHPTPLRRARRGGRANKRPGPEYNCRSPARAPARRHASRRSRQEGPARPRLICARRPAPSSSIFARRRGVSTALERAQSGPKRPREVWRGRRFSGTQSCLKARFLPHQTAPHKVSTPIWMDAIVSSRTRPMHATRWPGSTAHLPGRLEAGEMSEGG